MTRTVMLVFCSMLVSGVAVADPSLLRLPRVTMKEAAPLERMQAGEDKIQCAVRFIYAREEGPTDKELEKYKKSIKGYKSLKLLGQTSLTIPQGKSRQAQVPDSGKMSVRFIEKLLKGKDRLRLRVELTVPPKLKKSIIAMNNNSTQLVGQPYKKGSLVIAITCHAQ